MLALALVVLGVVTGCGQAPATPAHDPSPDGSYPGRSGAQVLAAALAAADAASAVRLTGSLTQSGHTVDYVVTEVPGKGTVGTVTIDGATVTIRRIGKIFYTRPSSKFLAGQGLHLSTLRGRWLKVDQQLAAVAGLGDFDSIGSLDSIVALVPKNQTFTRVASATVGGVATTGLRFSGGEVLVATTGQPYPVRITGSSIGSVTLSHWNEKVAVSVPAKAVDVGKLSVSSLG
jgi:hypothetical protein